MGLLSSFCAAWCAASRSMSMEGTVSLSSDGPGEPEVVGGWGRVGPAGRTALQHQVEGLGAHAAVGVEQHDDSGGEGRGDDLTDRRSDRRYRGADQDDSGG